jgi:hypothetical protein
MAFEKHLRLMSGEILEIPERLREVIISEKATIQSALNLDQIDENIDIVINLPEECYLEGSHLALQTMFFLQGEEQKNDEGILFLGLYVDKKAWVLSGMGKQEKALEILYDAMELEKVAFSHVKPAIARRLADLMIMQSEYAIRICGLFGSIHVLASHATELFLALETASTFWEPEFSLFTRKIRKQLDNFLRYYGNDFRSENARKVYDAFYLLKKDSPKQTNHKPRKHLDILNGLVEVFLEMLQQEILLTAHVNYSSDGLNSEIIQYQAENLVGKVEKRLRSVIAKKYQKQFDKSWVSHIEAKYKPMFERWQRYMQKDQTAFKIYDNYSPEILDYALIEDLKDLIVAQWHLFREVFDFGYQDRNKAVFYDKIAQIVNVRNALAHHRMPPENELLRARVLCTDILLALDRAGEIDE